LRQAKTLHIVAIALICAGAFGNIIDSMFYGLLFNESHELQVSQFLPAGGGYAPFMFGNVVDMLHFSFFPPVFNIADSAITIGVVILVLWQKSFFGKKGAEQADTVQDLPTGNQPGEEPSIH
jgi:signal peptidase II